MHGLQNTTSGPFMFV